MLNCEWMKLQLLTVYTNYTVNNTNFWMANDIIINNKRNTQKNSNWIETEGDDDEEE